MRIVLTSLGTVGDVRPCVALAAELRRHGHDTIFALPSDLVVYAQQFGFETTQLGPDIRGAHEATMRLAASGDLEAGLNPYEQALLAAFPQALQQLQALCVGADLLIAADVMPLGRFVHDLLGIPYVSLQLWYPIDLPAIDEQSARQHPLNVARAQLGLPLLADPRLAGSSPQLALLALSRALLPADLPLASHQHVTGFFFLEEEWQPDASLAAFLAAGPPPILFTFGSAMHDDPRQLTATFVDAVTALGGRAIIQQGWSGLGHADALPATIYPAEYLAHGWLFPQVACVVHHGGAGTTATALRAGVPTVVIPHSGDQFALAERARELGTAGPVVPYRELSAARLRDALAEVLGAPHYQVAAAAARKRVLAEQGIQTARALIESFVAGLGRSG